MTNHEINEAVAKKLFVLPNYEMGIYGDRELEGYKIVEDKRDEFPIAVFANKTLAIKTARFLEKHV